MFQKKISASCLVPFGSDHCLFDFPKRNRREQSALLVAETSCSVGYLSLLYVFAIGTRCLFRHSVFLPLQADRVEMMARGSDGSYMNVMVSIDTCPLKIEATKVRRPFRACPVQMFVFWALLLQIVGESRYWPRC